MQAESTRARIGCGLQCDITLSKYVFLRGKLINFAERGWLFVFVEQGYLDVSGDRSCYEPVHRQHVIPPRVLLLCNQRAGRTISVLLLSYAVVLKCLFKVPSCCPRGCDC